MSTVLSLFYLYVLVRFPESLSENPCDIINIESEATDSCYKKKMNNYLEQIVISVSACVSNLPM